MMKKILLGVVLSAISVGLVYGAVIRTDLRSTTGIASNERSSDRGSGNQENSGSNGNNVSDRGSRNGSGNSRSNGDLLVNNEIGSPQADVDETFLFDGFIQEVNEDYMVVEASDGSQIVVENRAWWYASDAGFLASVGDELSVTGFYDDDGAFEVISMENETQNSNVVVRDDSGRPLWAGNGNSSGNSNGNGNGGSR